jgi:hypothetical protein
MAAPPLLTDLIERFFRQTLTAYANLTALVPAARIAPHNERPWGLGYPYVSWVRLSTEDVIPIGNKRAAMQAEYLITAVTHETGRDGAFAIAAEVYACFLATSQGTVAGTSPPVNVTNVRHHTEWEMPIVDQGETYHRIGGIYRTWIDAG